MRTPHDERVADLPDGSPERTCVLSGAHGARAALIRLALSPPGEDGARTVAPDVLARAPGRGAWLGVSRPVLEKAAAKGKLKHGLMRAFGRHLDGAPLIIPADLGERIEAALVRALTDRLGLELRAGRLLLGSDRIAEQARGGRVAWLGHASDAGEDGTRKLDQAFRVGEAAAGRVDDEGDSLRRGGAILPLDRTALSVALGRDNVVHLALTDRGAASRIDAVLQRLLEFQGRAGRALEDAGTGGGGTGGAGTCAAGTGAAGTGDAGTAQAQDHEGATRAGTTPATRPVTTN